MMMNGQMLPSTLGCRAINWERLKEIPSPVRQRAPMRPRRCSTTRLHVARLIPLDTVQTLKGSKMPTEYSRLRYAIEDPAAERNVNGRSYLAAILHSTADQVLEDHNDLCASAVTLGNSPTFIDMMLKVLRRDL